MRPLQNVRRELRQRSSEKLKELYRIAKQQSGGGGGSDGMNGSDATGGPSIMDDTYGETGTGDTAADAAAAGGEGAEVQNRAAIARLEKKASGLSVFTSAVVFGCAYALLVPLWCCCRRWTCSRSTWITWSDPSMRLLAWLMAEDSRKHPVESYHATSLGSCVRTWSVYDH